jgi:hypothetical protein
LSALLLGGLAIEAQADLRLRLEAGWRDGFVALQANAVNPVVDASQSERDLVQQAFGLFAAGKCHLLLLYCVGARNAADRLLIEGHGFRGIAAQAELAFEFLPTCFECGPEYRDSLLPEFVPGRAQEASAACR